MSNISWNEVETLLQSGVRIPVLLHGRPGTGKSHAVNSVCKYHLTLTPETPAAELRGHFIPKDGSFMWHDGPLVRAMREGAAIAIHELDHRSDDCTSLLYAALDDPAFASLTLPTGETVRPAIGYRVVSTMNGRPEELPEALRDRFAVTLAIDMINPALLSRIPEAFRVAVESVDKQRVSARSAIAFSELRGALGDDLALRSVFGHRAVEIANSLALSGHAGKGC